MAELQGQVSQMTSDLKEERVAGKRVRAELQQLQDDHAELVAERDSLQKVWTPQREGQREGNCDS